MVLGLAWMASLKVSKGVSSNYNTCNGWIGVKTEGFDFQIEK